MRLVGAALLTLILFSEVAEARCPDIAPPMWGVRYESESCWQPSSERGNPHSTIYLSRTSLEKLIARAELAGFQSSELPLVALINILISIKAKKLETIKIRYPIYDSCYYYSVERGSDKKIDVIYPNLNEKQCGSLKINLAILLLYHLKEIVAFDRLGSAFAHPGSAFDVTSMKSILGYQIATSFIKKGASFIKKGDMTINYLFIETADPIFVKMKGEEYDPWLAAMQYSKFNDTVILSRSGAVAGVVASLDHRPDEFGFVRAKFWPANKEMKRNFLSGRLGKNFENTIKYIPRDNAGHTLFYANFGAGVKVPTEAEWKDLDYAAAFIKHHGVDVEKIDDRIRALIGR